MLCSYLPAGPAVRPDIHRGMPTMASTKLARLITLTLLFCASGLPSLASGLVSLPHISSRPSNASQVLDPRLASFSFELSYLPTFAGNISHPNVLTKELMQRLVERTGVGPDIRPGGVTMQVFFLDSDVVALTHIPLIEIAPPSIQTRLLWCWTRARCVVK